MNSFDRKDSVPPDEKRQFASREDAVIREKPRIRRGEYPVTQEQVDGIVQNELSGIRFSAKPKVNNRIRSPGKTTRAYNMQNDRYELVIEIGKQYPGSPKDLVDTLIHEELEARIITNRHHRDLYYGFLHPIDNDAIHAYIQRIVDWYLAIRGSQWTQLM